MGWLDGLGSAFSNLFSSGAGSSGSALVSEPGMDWGSGFMDLGKNVAKEAIPGLVSTGIGLGANALFPGKQQSANLVDTRQGVTQQGAQMALGRAQNIQANPASFGLPGDPYDVNTPAGKRRYDITKTSRSADAARGGLNTGGSAVRENNALNTAVGNEYNKVWGDSMGTLAGQQGMSGYMSPAEENPWAKLVGGAVSPAVSKGLSALLADWGMAG